MEILGYHEFWEFPSIVLNSTDVGYSSPDAPWCNRRTYGLDGAFIGEGSEGKKYVL
jgi:hypothetical protein